MSSDFHWKKLDIKPLGRALAERRIPRSFYNKIMSREPNIKYSMEKIESASGVSPFPPTVLVPEGIYDFEFRMVIHAHITPYKTSRYGYPAIELSAPSVYFMPETWFLGLLGHEFLHYVVHTVNLHKKLVELESKGDSKSPVTVGVIPDKEKMSVKERDYYFYDDPKVWFEENMVIEAIEKLDSKGESSSGQELTKNVLNWINQKKVMKEFKRGEVVGYYGKPWLHKSILEKAKKLGLL